MTEKEELLIQDTPTEMLLSAHNLQNVFKTLFEQAEIITTKVRRGSKSSANIYVPKEHIDKLVTVIIWKNK